MPSLNTVAMGKIRRVIWLERRLENIGDKDEEERGTGGALENSSRVVRRNSYCRLDGDGKLIK